MQGKRDGFVHIPAVHARLAGKLRPRRRRPDLGGLRRSFTAESGFKVLEPAAVERDDPVAQGGATFQGTA